MRVTSDILFVANQLFHLRPGASVGDIGFGEPRTAGLKNAVAKNVEAVGGVGVGVDGDGNAVLFGGGAVYVVQVQPHGVGVELQQFAVLLCGGHDSVEIDFIGLAAVDQPASGMGDNRDVRVFDGAE